MYSGSFFQNPAHNRDSNPHLIFYLSETVKRVWIRFENIQYIKREVSMCMTENHIMKIQWGGGV